MLGLGLSSTRVEEGQLFYRYKSNIRLVYKKEMIVKRLVGIKTMLVFALAIGLLSACAKPQETPEAEPTSPAPTQTATIEVQPTTQITIDGKMDDWADYDVLGTDPSGDQVPGSPDLAEVRAFSNDRYFYLLISLHEDGETDHYDILLDVNGGDNDYQLSVWPSQNQAVFAVFPVSGGMEPLDGVTVAQDEVIELKMPLTATEGKSIQGVFIQTFLGDRAGDMIGSLPAQVVDELEPETEKVAGDSQPPAPTGICSGEGSSTFLEYTLTESGMEVELLWQAEFVPWWVRTSADGRVLAVTNGGDSIYELMPDGSIEVVFRCPGVIIETGVAATDGALWFASRDGGRLYRADPDGTVRVMAENGNRNLEAGLDGSVYAMENGLTRIDPDGTIEKISDAVFGRKFAVSPKGVIVALTGGSVVQISESGELTQLASGYGPEPWLTFGPDGLLYVTHWSGVDVIDLENGSVSSIPWLQNANLSEAGAFTPDGRLLMYHPNTNVYAVDLETQTIEVYYQVTSNSWAMAANPGDSIYVAFGDGQPNGETTIYRVMDSQTLESIMTVPYGIERGMAFDSQGNGYLALGDTSAGGAILRFDPVEKTFQEYHRPACIPFSITVHPQTDLPWWDECDRLVSLDEQGELVEIGDIPGGQNVSLAISLNGEFYVIAFFPRDDPRASFQRRLYHWNDGDVTWEEITDLSQSDPGITLATLVSCPDGMIYTIESLGPESLPVNRASMNAVRRLESDGTLTLLGFDFSFDGLAADCDSVSGQIVFTSGLGIFGVTPP
jgi:streptogramin lyase